MKLLPAPSTQWGELSSMAWNQCPISLPSYASHSSVLWRVRSRGVGIHISFFEPPNAGASGAER